MKQMKPVDLNTQISAYEGTIQIAWDSTSLSRFLTCPRLYYYTNIKGYKPKKVSVHLEFGIYYHSALELYTKMVVKGADHRTALHYAVLAALISSKDFKSDDTYKNRAILIKTIVDYLEHYRHDTIKPIILENNQPAVELSFRFELDQSTIFCGHMDRLVEFNNEIYTLDHKTTKMALGKMYFDQYSVSVQPPLYTLAGQVVYNKPTKGILIDAAQILVGGTRFQRHPVPFGKAWLTEWVEMIKHKIALAYQYAKSDFWPMNPTACHKFGGCDFRSVCSRSPEVRHLFLSADFVIDRWDPLVIRNGAEE